MEESHTGQFAGVMRSSSSLASCQLPNSSQPSAALKWEMSGCSIVLNFGGFN
jgi:hypothetical protein